MSGNFTNFKIEMTGAACAKDLFGAELTPDLNSAIAMPAELDLEWNNVVETGYEAVFVRACHGCRCK